MKPIEIYLIKSKKYSQWKSKQNYDDTIASVVNHWAFLKTTIEQLYSVQTKYLPGFPSNPLNPSIPRSPFCPDGPGGP